MHGGAVVAERLRRGRITVAHGATSMMDQWEHATFRDVVRAVGQLLASMVSAGVVPVGAGTLQQQCMFNLSHACNVCLVQLVI